MRHDGDTAPYSTLQATSSPAPDLNFRLRHCYNKIRRTRRVASRRMSGRDRRRHGRHRSPPTALAPGRPRSKPTVRLDRIGNIDDALAERGHRSPGTTQRMPLTLFRLATLVKTFDNGSAMPLCSRTWQSTPTLIRRKTSPLLQTGHLMRQMCQFCSTR